MSTERENHETQEPENIFDYVMSGAGDRPTPSQRYDAVSEAREVAVSMARHWGEPHYIIESETESGYAVVSPTGFRSFRDHGWSILQVVRPDHEEIASLPQTLSTPIPAEQLQAAAGDLMAALIQLDAVARVLHGKAREAGMWVADWEVLDVRCGVTSALCKASGSRIVTISDLDRIPR